MEEFVGRERELDALAMLLEPVPRVPVIIHGPGGIGKTWLAEQFTLRQGLKSNWLYLFSETEPHEALEKLVSQTRREPWEAIIIDGAELLAEAALKSALEFLQHSTPLTKILVTTRYATHLEGTESLALNPLSHEDAVALLARGFGVSSSDASLGVLADELGNIPLALAMSYTFSDQMSVDQVIERIRRLQGTLYTIETPRPEATEVLIQRVRPRIIKASDRLIEHIARDPREMRSLSPRKFEELIANLLREMGWDITLTPQTRDGGRDILAYFPTPLGWYLTLVEAKRYRADRPVGVDIVREVYGTLCDEQANSAMVVTTSRFTPDAKMFEERHQFQIDLKDYEDVVTWIRHRGKEQL